MATGLRMSPSAGADPRRNSRSLPSPCEWVSEAG
ncbi:unnamed protein product [Rhodiola kirilowii]